MSHQAQSTTDEVYISFSSEVNRSSAEALVGIVAEQANRNKKKITILLSTPGGDVSAGIMAYNVLRGMPIELTTHNVGTVNSIGNVIFLAGSRRYACRTSSFMFHGVAMATNQPVRFEEKDLIEKLANVKNDQGLIADIINQRTTIDAQEAEALFLKAAFMRGDEARQKGLIHDILDVSVPTGTPIIQLRFQR